MLNTKDVQHGVKKFTLVCIFTLAMVLLGALVNKFPLDKESIVLGRDFNCYDILRRNLSAWVTQFNNYSDYTVLVVYTVAQKTALRSKKEGIFLVREESLALQPLGQDR
jgi:hypothetical protein